MTHILAIETATDACSVALYRDGEVLERFEPGARRQTERVLPLVDDLLAEAGVGLGSLDALAFGQGPGAFTGVRVATSVIQGLAFARDLPVAGVSTLAACALAAFDAHPDRPRVLAAFDARMGELYLGAYQCHADGVETLLADGLFDPDDVPALDGADWLLAGSGAVYRERVAARVTLAAVDEAAAPRASAVARLAAPLVAAGLTVPAEQAQPVYLRDRVV
ncbi:tRNA (adenosine(37)-N6)-threonylcarbamoyltransferase complex dimerization subunit type 1 TsaB [Alcanivorax marinus]|uniref:tRNA threonylcarbamoyladenosine biosynthesis protein TsaB n=1 Tax=Alloalcanivorax marinus TaxID=1177169 RepID=A0A9Q3ULJ3_9GAMM|nr:tRNA (adenosine(37)-N6)-threonylcarbamoyltransferase complex dimerization subunit type 1 TsaB [Alloalcanivorax marinus]MCC4307704.1 tRNA (adenosine(37)-N6)-threonylcarbamoyltransferase complex dimerization subunit type 1 TsaB [Alloalcanivorax marinus]